MNLAPSFFVSTTIHPKPVTLADGTTHTLNFRELPGHEWVRFRMEQQSPDPEVAAKAVPRLIAASLCLPDGKPAITEEQAFELKAEPMTALMKAVTEVNTFNAKKPSPSAAESGSSTS